MDSNNERCRVLEKEFNNYCHSGLYTIVPKDAVVFLATSTEEGNETYSVLSEKEIFDRYDVNNTSAGNVLEEFLETSFLGDEWISANLLFESIEQIDKFSFCTLRYQL